MATGTGSYFLALAGNLIISLIAYTLFKTNYGSIIKSEFIIQFRIKSGDTNVSEKYNKILSKYSRLQTLLSSEAAEDNSSIKISIDVVLKEGFDSNKLLEEISSVDGLSEVVIIATKTDVDY